MSISARKGSTNRQIRQPIAVPELLNQAITAQGAIANPSPLTAAALLFLVVFLPLVRLTTWLERRYAVCPPSAPMGHLS